MQVYLYEEKKCKSSWQKFRQFYGNAQTADEMRQQFYIMHSRPLISLTCLAGFLWRKTFIVHTFLALWEKGFSIINYYAKRESHNKRIKCMYE